MNSSSSCSAENLFAIDELLFFCSPLKSPDENENMTPADATYKTTTDPSSSSLLAKNSPALFNPFGPAVGLILNIYTCNLNNNSGDLFVTTKAVCFRRTFLFGIDIEKLVIPWVAIKSLYRHDDGRVIITRENKEDLELDGFSLDSEVVVDILLRSWKRYDEQTNSNINRNVRVTRNFHRHTSILLADSDTDDTAFEGSTDLSEEDNSESESTYPSSNVVIPPESDDVSAKEMDITWKKIRNEENKIYREIVAKDLKLNCTLDEFYTNFLSNDAPLSLASHHEHEGDLKVTSTNWVGNAFAKKRQITYNHPIRVPLAIAPPAGAATKTQKMTRFGDHGICVDTETWINDVPMADCFYVADRLLVTSLPDGSVLLTIKFGNIFIKRTMLKGIIESTSVRDVTVFHKSFIEAIRQYLQSKSSPRAPPPCSNVGNNENEESDKIEKPRIRLDLNLSLVWLLLLFSFISHVYLIQKLQSTTEQLARVESFLIEKQSSEF